ncbi:MAG TPA: pilus assembly PilX N-terminal domain-containing protein [Phycisphaerae bacterium]|nr:pilus assembly PilX N-terminal domain-containing protein [Phycisphaerae bacterium]
MRSPGSVLIVVLGLLAVLAVVGITFVTMTNIDRRTAANFALQSQFMLAGDAAVDYVCHHLVQDLWYYDLTTQRYAYQAGGGGGGGSGLALLLTDQNNQPGQELARNEPFDYPSEDYDPWLSSPPQYAAGQGLTIPFTGHFSYGEIGGTFYGLTSWGFPGPGRPGTPPGERPNNLGWPTRQGSGSVILPYTQGNGHGVWNPDLSFPFDVGLIRVSVTVLDHGSMINLNAHGRSDESVNGADGCPRYGYFISDVNPEHEPFRFNLGDLLNGPAKVHGLWNSQTSPYNDRTYQAVIENPSLGDHPFTLDEEFELRRLTGTHFTSRLEEFAGNNLKCDPDTFTESRARNRASLTTVSWTSEVRPDFEGPGGQMLDVETPLPDGTEDAEWSPRKIDLNLDPVEYIKDAMETGYVFDVSDEDVRKIRNQLAANISAFRDGSDAAADPLEPCTEANGRVGAGPQPMFGKIKVSIASQDLDGEEVVSTTWAIEVQVISPWRGNIYGDTGGLSVNNVTLAVVPAEGHVGGTTWDPSFPQDARMPSDAAQGQQWVHKLEVEVDKTEPITAAVNRIELRAGGMTLDRIDGPLLAEFSAADARHREIARELEKRRPGDTESIDVVYVGDWQDGDGGSMTSFSFAGVPASGIPIRFPRSVRVSTDKEETATRSLPLKGLPPYAPPAGAGGAGFRAFTRVADLNQVLCPTPDDLANVKEGDDFFWPWVTRVAQKAAQGGNLLAAEERLKFNWNDSEPTTPGTYSRMNAANVFCVGGPWLDGIDNDGDGAIDEQADKGTGPTSGDATDKGRFGGPELRVAGKINLNTATQDTLVTLEKSFGMPDNLLKGYVETFRTQKRPIVTPSQLVKQSSPEAVPGHDEEAKGAVEKRDLPFTLISNIATVRSDTFSIYGTVEYGLLNRNPNAPPEAEFQVTRRRRFWALVDRSPCLAYPPGELGADNNFIRPRVLNFQWLD